MVGFGWAKWKGINIVPVMIQVIASQHYGWQHFQIVGKLLRAFTPKFIVERYKWIQ